MHYWSPEAALEAERRGRAVARQVFDTVELAEHILHFLPSGEIIRARQLSKYTKTLVQNSTKLHKSIFLNTDDVLLEVQENGCVRCHGSWTKVKQVPGYLIISQIHNVFQSDDLSTQMIQRDPIEFYFDGAAFLKTRPLQDWKPEGYVFGKYGIGAWLSFDELETGQKPKCFKKKVLTMGTLYAALLRKAESNRKKYWDPPLNGDRVSLFIDGHIHEDSWDVVWAPRCFQLPPSAGGTDWGSLEMRQLKMAIEGAGRRVYEHLEEEEVYARDLVEDMAAGMLE